MNICQTCAKLIITYYLIGYSWANLNRTTSSAPMLIRLQHTGLGITRIQFRKFVSKAWHCDRMCSIKSCYLKFHYVHWKTPVLESFNKVADLNACNFIKKRLQHRCFLVNIAKVLRIHISKNICERLLPQSLAECSVKSKSGALWSCLQQPAKGSTSFITIWKSESLSLLWCVYAKRFLSIIHWWTFYTNLKYVYFSGIHSNRNYWN